MTRGAHEDHVAGGVSAAPRAVDEVVVVMMGRKSSAEATGAAIPEVDGPVYLGAGKCL